MRLSKIQVSKLFGVFDHTVSLNLADRITIIHGPNGYGKTAVLLLVQSLLGNRFGKLRRVPFQTFAVTLEDGREISVHKDFPSKGEAEKEEQNATLVFRLKVAKQIQEEFKLPFLGFREGFRFSLEMIERHVDDLERVGPETWVNIQTGRKLQLEDVLETYGDFLPVNQQQKRKIPEWLTGLQKEFDVRLIEAQRLLSFAEARRPRRPESVRFEPAVSSYSKELAAKIQEVQAQYGTFSQQLDSSFPMRAIQFRSPAAIDATELAKKLEELEASRQRIIAAGLLAPQAHATVFGPQQTQAVEEPVKGILALLAQDVEKKLSVFDEITAKVELFKELVNKRFSYKHLDIEGEAGFRFQTSAGLQLLPTDLSSGEQHELVLLYELLFKTKPNALILIDEPELSLHVAWQVQFLKDLARVIKLSSFDVVLATHSPQIIDTRWDLTVELKGPEA